MDRLADAVSEALFAGVSGGGITIPRSLRLLLESERDPSDRSFTEWPPADRESLLRTVAAGEFGDRPRTELAELTMRCASVALSSPTTIEALGYNELPTGMSWPDTKEALPPTTPLDEVRDAYDVIIVGAGAGGGVAAHVLSDAGLSVLVLERARLAPIDELRGDHARSARVFNGEPRPVDLAAGDTQRKVDGRYFAPGTPEWNANVMTVGGGTRVYGAMAWRFSPEDFRMGATYGDDFADWPISYNDLAPYYDAIEWEMGVAGSPDLAPFDGERARAYPMPSVPLNSVGRTLSRGAAKLGLPTTAPPMLINTVGYNARPSCRQCAMCVGHACRADAKNGTHNTVLLTATRSGGARLVDSAVVTLLLTDSDHAVTGVRFDKSGVRRSVRAQQVVVAAGAIETARLLLASSVGNEHDQVGRHLQGHIYAGASGLFSEPVEDFQGPGPSIATTAYRHGNPEVPGGGILANDFTPAPYEAWGKLTDAGFVDSFGASALTSLAAAYPRSAVVIGPVQEVPSMDSRITLDADRTDAWGVPLVELSSAGHHAYDLVVSDLLAERASEWLAASGADRVVHTFWRESRGPSAGQHQAGTCRMGVSPEQSVTDHLGRVWGWEGVTVADGSLHVTNGGVNPVLTILANTWRVAEALAVRMNR